MLLSEIIDLEKIFGGSIDLEKKTIELKFLGFTVKRIKYGKLKELIKDTSNTERILSELFLNKQVMWQNFSKEKVEYCLLSLEDLKSKCEFEQNRFTETKRDSDNLISTLLRRWTNFTDEAIKEFRTAQEHEAISRSEPFHEILHASDDIPLILGEYRKNTLPIVEKIVEFLPSNNIIKKDTLNKLSYSKDITIKAYNIQTELIKTGEYKIND